MRFYISIDAEGLPGIFHPSQLLMNRPLFKELRSIMTKVALTAAEELNASGAEEVWIADGHAFMGNIDYERVPDYVRLIRGSLRPLSQVCCIDRGFDGVLFLGYHSGAGVRESVLDHTYSGRAFFEVRIGGERASEYLINALVAGEHGVPVILVMGDDKLRLDVEKHTPWAVYVEVKESLSRYAGVMKPLGAVLKELRNGVREAVRRVRDGEVRPLSIGVIEAEFVFRRSEYADAASLLPFVDRVGAYTVRFTGRASEVYALMQALTYLVIGVSAAFS